jgi:hypothetical protein
MSEKEVRGQRTEVRGQGSGVRGQRSEVKKQLLVIGYWFERYVINLIKKGICEMHLTVCSVIAMLYVRKPLKK